MGSLSPSPLPLPSLPHVDSSLYLVERNVMMPMRDGTRLATDIYFPASGGKRREGKFPAILQRTPYNKEGNFHASHGLP